jgi:uncharacterized protein (DUF362 family)
MKHTLCSFGTSERDVASRHAETSPPRLNRRALLAGTCAAAAAMGVGGLAGRAARRRASVFIARGQRYDGSLAVTIRDGLVAAGLDPALVRGTRVLLKPNMVEPVRQAPHISTHPAVVFAAIEVFRSWGAEVTVGEGPGHLRDTEAALVESGIEEVLHATQTRFADLNYEETRWTGNLGRASGLKGFHFPRTAVEADWIVSLPKLKTHHHVGVTASMKNLYGVIPGIRYGWPKNVLHHHGIPQTVYDINASLPKTIAIVDAIQCMEGDGPIMGTAKHMGLVLIGTVPTAVDATVARLMDLVPERIPYLQLAADRLGPVEESRIEQRGEAWQPLARRFAILDKPHLRRLQHCASASG